MWKDHKEMVKDLVKPGYDIAADMTESDAHLIHMCMGISGETGELLDAIKKAVIYRKPLDMVNLIEELGDIEFYLEGLRSHLNISRDDVIKANIDKLSKRYSAGTYSDAQAINRDDKLVELIDV